MVVHVKHQVLAHHRQPYQADIASSFRHYNHQCEPVRGIAKRVTRHRVSFKKVVSPRMTFLSHASTRKIGPHRLSFRSAGAARLRRPLLLFGEATSPKE